MLNPFEIRNVPGNRALLFLANSADEVAYDAFMLGVLPALNHFGFPYRVHDLAGDSPLPPLTDACAGVVLAHDGVGSALTSEQQQALDEAVGNGLGIASFDGRLWQTPTAVHALFGVVDQHEEDVSDVSATQPLHYVMEMQEIGAVHTFKQPVGASIPGGLMPGFEQLAADTKGHTLMVAGHPAGTGKRVALLISPELWLRQYFGHCMGLDDLLWRPLVWIATKPFAVLMMPPFVTCRIDDASGSYDHFGYIATLNEFSWIPNVGLFLEDIDEEDAKAVKRYHDAGIAQFSAHSFHEIGAPYPDQIYIRHDGTEYTLEELKENFTRVDAFFERVGITPSHTVNVHYDEKGLNVLPFLARRNQTFTMSLIPYGVHWYANSYSWAPYPYGHQGFNYGPMQPDPRFWNAEAHYLSSYKTPEAGMAPGEFMGANTVFNNESPNNNIAGAIDKGVRAVKVGVASGFFGTLMCHEQRIASVSPGEWREIIKGIAEGLSGWPLIYRSYDFIAQYTKDRARTRIVNALYDTAVDNLIVELEGTCDEGVSCLVFKDHENHEDHCVYDLVDTPAFVGRYAFPE